MGRETEGGEVEEGRQATLADKSKTTRSYIHFGISGVALQLLKFVKALLCSSLYKDEAGK